MHDSRARGEEIRRSVLGEKYVDNALREASLIQDMVTEIAWGTVWSRPGLSRRERSLLSVALLAAMGRERELAAHLRGALRNGCSKDELKEALLHVAMYAGFPAAVSGDRLLSQLELED